MPIPFSAKAMSGGPEGDPLGIKAIGKLYRKAIREIPWVMDYPGTPGVAIAPFLGTVRMAKDPGKLLGIFRRIFRSANPSRAATFFGHAFRRNPQVKRALREARAIADMEFKTLPPSQARSESAFLNALLREASESAEGTIHPRYAFPQERARMSAEKARRKAYEAGERILSGKPIGKKEVVPHYAPNTPILTSSNPVNDILYLEFDIKAGRGPSAHEIKKYAYDKGFEVDVTEFRPNILSVARGTKRFRLDVHKGGKSSAEEALKLSRHFGGSFQTYPTKVTGVR